MAKVSRKDFIRLSTGLGLGALTMASSPLLASRMFQAAKPLQRIAFGSCNRVYLPQHLWTPILRNRPDLWIWLGDIIYADTQDPKKMERTYRLLANRQGYKELRRSTPVLGIWDDHDYGANNAGKEYPMREESQRLILDFLGEAPDSNRRRQAGIYASYVCGTIGSQVKVILLDVRYHRQQPGANADILGEEQWTWLENELATSTAQVHLIASGVQVLPSEQRFEKWGNFPFAKSRLLETIRRFAPANTIFLSGDRHFSEMSALRLDQSNVYEVTSSGMTHSYSRGPDEKNSLRIERGFGGKSFGQIDFNWSRKTLTMQVIDQHNRPKISRVIEL